MFTFKEITVSQAIDIIREADSEKAFLPSLSDPDFSVEKFLLHQDPLGFRLYGALNEANQVVSFIS